MKIISKFNDYYDIARIGIDPNIKFYREEGQPFRLELPSRDYPIRLDGVSARSTNYTFDFGVVIFCGDVYPFVRIVESTSNLYGVCAKMTYVYSVEQFHRYAKPVSDGEAKIRIPVRLFYRPNAVNHLSQIYDHLNKKWPANFIDNCKMLLIKHKCAYAVSNFEHEFNHGLDCHAVPMEERLKRFAKTIPYASLKEVQFFRALGPYEAYQKLEMYVSSTLAPRDVMKIDPISDKLKAESHGFDKFSFRADKTSKKRKT